MTGKSTLTIDRDIEEVKAQVKKELETVRGLMDTFDYRKNSPDWKSPFHLHRLRRSLRIHYLAYKIRDSTPVPLGTNELEWDLEEDIDTI